MALSTYIWSKQVTAVPADDSAGNLAGHRLVMAITDSSVIDENPFIMQRSPVTPGSSDFEDAFFSVASVTDMADLAVGDPASGSVFYRTNQIDLLFPIAGDLYDAVADIESYLGALLKANDEVQELSTATIGYYPSGSHERYWGVSASASLTDEQILTLDHEEGTSRATSKVLDTDGGALYLYMLYRAELGAGAFTLGGSSVAMTLVTRNVVNANGHSASYRIYRTTATHTGSALTLAVV